MGLPTDHDWLADRDNARSGLTGLLRSKIREQRSPEANSVTTTRTISVEQDDPLGYGEPRVLDRLRHMAEDAVNKVNEASVKEEAAILSARLIGRPKSIGPEQPT